MVLPVEQHRIPALAHLRKRYDADSEQVQEGQPQALGIVATIGLLGLVAAALAALALPERRTLMGNMVLPLAALTLAAFVIGTVGGFSSVFAYVVTPQLRAWARMSIFISFFSLVAIALAAEWVRLRQGAGRAIGLAAVLLVVGFLDQTNAGSVPDYGSVETAYRSDAALVSGIEHALGPGAAVFQLPYEPFPEPQPAWIPDIGPYSLGRGYIHSHDLRWSYGLMKGRSGDWQNAVVQLPPALVARAAAAVGFTGMYVDRGAYADNAVHVLAALQREIGAPVMSSPDGRLAFLDMRAYASGLRSRGPALGALRRAVLDPVGVSLQQGFAGLRQDLTGRAYPMEREGRILLRNPWATRRPVTISLKLVPAYPAPASVQITWPDGQRQTAKLPRDGAVVNHGVALAPGVSPLALTVKGRPQFSDPNVTQTYYLRVLDPLVVDGAFAPFGSLPRDHRAASWLEPFGRI
jgi:phosphoglycerol transferase